MPPRGEYSQRRRRLAAELERRKLDAVIVTALPNIRYLSGFTGSNAALLATAAGDAVLFTDPRYQIQAADEADCRVRVVKGSLLKALLETARRKGLCRLGFEAQRLSFAEHEMLRAGLWLGAWLEPQTGLIEDLRMVKSPAELEAIRGAMQIASRAFCEALCIARPGVLEIELAAEIEYRMRRLGAEKPAFDSIVLGGARTALPHARAGREPLRANELVLVDVGAVKAGYSSDMTRMAFLGRPDERVKRLYEAVREAQQAALEAVRPGLAADVVDRAARRLLAGHGLERAFVHSTGHGLGLEIHEAPRLGKGERLRLAAGMVVTVEPGAYLEGFGGVRIEDTIVVTSNGCEILTPASKELLAL